jgi:hypothetical protein
MKYFAFVALILAAVDVASAQQMVITSAKGQSPARMEQDKAECQSIAQQTSGYNPSQPASAPSNAPRSRGGRARGTAVGAMAGAVKAEVNAQQRPGYANVNEDVQQQYRQNQAKSSAAAGVVIGGSQQRRQRRQLNAQQAQQTSQASAGANSFNQSYKSCLIGRGYSVQ